MMRSFLATSVIELFHDSDVACHHGDTLTGQAGMETADKSELKIRRAVPSIGYIFQAF